MNIKVNGEPIAIGDGVTIHDLLSTLGYDNAYVAVALNSECVRRSSYTETVIKNGDDVEILAPMAGG